jgi:hypothetical protein
MQSVATFPFIFTMFYAGVAPFVISIVGMQLLGLQLERVTQ